MNQEELANSVAIIGLAGRFPGAANLEAFWHNLAHGVESIRFFGEAELERRVIDAAELRNPAYVKARAVLDDIELFDAAFFGFTPREAELTDPQHRFFLECAWEALEHAGYNPDAYPGVIGVFGGAGANTYLLFNLAANGQLIGSAAALQAFIHNKNDHLTARTAYKLNLRGPSITVQTACSTSLVAVALACQSLLTYQIDMALAGGATITTPQQIGYLYHERGIGSPDGHCRPFDAQAQGTVGGNGVGLIVLKRYEDALNDGDTIYALIRGAAVNNDGALRAGYTAPNADSQTEVIALAQGLAGVHPETITYVEAHGTATPMGDPIEIQALTQAFRRETGRNSFCAIGSVKSNIGHLDTAAGIAGLIKTVLALTHKQIPPSLHYQAPNPAINFAASPFYVNTRLRDWWTDGFPRRAGVSSFGLGGTNAHVVLEEAPLEGHPNPQSRSGESESHLIILSARTPTALEAMCHNLATHLQAQRDWDMADVAYTLQVGRKSFEQRRMFVCHDRAEAIRLLEALTPEQVFSRTQPTTHRPIAFMFPGQGAQQVNMGRTLYQSEPVFRAAVDACAEILAPLLGLDIRALIYPPDGAEADASQHLGQTRLTQPALFVIEYALAQMWLAWGIEPQAMIGHSIGEYVAACLAGVMTLEGALKLVAARGRLIQQLPPGAMLAVPLAEEAIRPWLSEAIALAAVNGPAQCVVAGPTEAVAAVERTLTAQGHICHRLQTSHAFHSGMMRPIAAEFEALVRQTPLAPPQRPYLSNVTGDWIRAEEATDPSYWARHMCETVRFGDGLARLLADPERVLLEVGPGRTLRTLARWHPHKKPAQFMLATLPTPAETGNERAWLKQTLGHLWLAGIEPNWAAMYSHTRRRRVALPTYPFERRRYWVDLPAGAGRGALPPVGSKGDPLARRRDLTDWFYTPTWRETPPVTAADLAPYTGDWLLWLDDAGLLERLGHRLTAAQQRVITVERGAAFRRVSDTHFQIDPTQPEGYVQLLAALDPLPARMVFGWGVLKSVGSAAPSMPEALARGLYALTYLAQAVGKVSADTPLELIILSSQLHPVFGHEVRQPEMATLLGPCLVIPQEYPNVRCRNIDIALVAGGQATAQLDAALFHEFMVGGDQPVTAYRQGRRWQRAFEALRLPEENIAGLLRPGGVYWITGGLGGLGLQIAAYLAAQVQARLVLISRTPLPERSQWEEWLNAHPHHDPISRQMRQLQSLESHGAELLLCAADVANDAQMRQVLAETWQRFGALHGVIHAAGVAAGGLMQGKDTAAMPPVLAAKIAGTRVLESVLANLPLDFWVFFSSLTSVVGRLGQVDYTAANAFLDAFAHDFQARTGIPSLAINWAAWDEVGMAARPAAAGSTSSLTGLAGSPPGLAGSPPGLTGSLPGLASSLPGELAEPTGAPVELTPHLLLERGWRAPDGQEVYLTDFNVEKHWVLDEHRILGNPVIPGVAYFEMVRAALGARATGHCLAFQNVLFVAPLRVADGATQAVYLVLNPLPDGAYTFAIRSRYGEGEQGPWRDFTLGKVAVQPAEPLTRYDLEAIRQRCNHKELLLAAEEREEDLGPRWHSVQRVHVGEDEVLLQLHLPEAFWSDFEAFVFHPALLDRAAGIAKNFLAPDGHYLPLTYKDLRIKAPLQPKIYSYARYRREDSPDQETITFDIVLLSPQGEGLVEITGFSQKRVNDPAAEIRALAGMLEARPDEAVTAMERPTPEGIPPAEGVAAFGRILAHPVRSQIVVCPRDLQAVIANSHTSVRERIMQAVPADAPTPQAHHPRPAIATPYAAPQSDLEAQIAAVWAGALGVERVGIDDNFFELGGDSLVAIQVISKLERSLNTHIPPVAVFEGATVRALARLVQPDSSESRDYDERQSRGEQRRQRQRERRQTKV